MKLTDKKRKKKKKKIVNRHCKWLFMVMMKFFFYYFIIMLSPFSSLTPLHWQKHSSQRFSIMRGLTWQKLASTSKILMFQNILPRKKSPKLLLWAQLVVFLAYFWVSVSFQLLKLDMSFASNIFIKNVRQQNNYNFTASFVMNEIK